MTYVIRRVLYGLIFIISLFYLYYQIPYFGILFATTVVSLLVFHKKEKNTYYEKLDAIDYTFSFQDGKYTSKKSLIIEFGLSVLFLVLARFVDFPYEMRKFENYDYVYLVLFFLIVFFIRFFESEYNHYYFHKDYVVKPGFKLEKIYWNQVELIEMDQEKERFYLKFKDGSKTLFDLKSSYSSATFAQIISNFNSLDVKKVY